LEIYPQVQDKKIEEINGICQVLYIFLKTRSETIQVAYGKSQSQIFRGANNAPQENLFLFQREISSPSPISIYYQHQG
jgi:hypothetical protein